MNRNSRPDALRLNTAHRAAPVSPGIERAARSPAWSLLSVPFVEPEPGYVAAATASEIATGEISTLHPDRLDLPLVSAAIASPALVLVNAFLDRVLFNFLTCARSTSLSALRRSMEEILRPHLAAEAIAGADEELYGYLREGEVLDAANDGSDFAAGTDVDLVWKRSRLQCMVYARLGDLEEERAEDWAVQAGLATFGASGTLDEDPYAVPPAVAIYLTSVLEFIGERALAIGSQVAYRRCEPQFQARTSERPESIRIVLEEMDMEKIALNPTLGRLWRAWRKSLRSSYAVPSTRQRRVRRASADPTGLASGDTPSLDGSGRDVAGREAPERASTAARRSGAAASAMAPRIQVHDDAVQARGHRPSPELGAGPPLQATEDPQPRPLGMLTDTQTADASRAAIGDAGGRATKAAHPGPPGTSRRTHRRSRSVPAPVVPSEADPQSLSSARIEAGPEEYQREPSPPLFHATAMPGWEHAIHEEVLGSLAGPVDYRTSGMSISAPTSVAGSPVRRGVRTRASRHSPADGFAPIDHDTRLEDGAEGDTDNALQFDQADYHVEPHEHDNANLGRKSSMAGYEQGMSERRARNAADARVSPLNYDARDIRPGDVSPLEQSPIRSGEVSPISDDEWPIDAGGLATAPKAPRDAMAAIMNRGRPRLESDEGEPGRELGPDIVYHPGLHSTNGHPRRMAGPTETDRENRGAFVIPQDVVHAGDLRPVSESSTLSGNDLQADGTITDPRTRTAMVRNGVPRSFGSSREITQAAADGSDRPPSSSIASDQMFPHLNTIAELRKQLPSVSTGSQADRTGTRRVSPPSGGDTVSDRLSESSIRDFRPTHVATISTPAPSKAKGKPGLRISGDFRPPLASRQSSDSTEQDGVPPRTRISSGGGGGGGGTVDKSRDFEQLINSGDTMQFTLTPQNIRELREPDQTSGTVRGQVFNARARALASTNSSPNSHGEPRTPSGPPATRGPRPQARDPKVADTSTKDFADFIRSTGPENQKVLPQVPDTPGKASGTEKGKENRLVSPRHGGKSTPLSSPRAGYAPRSSSKPEAREAVVGSDGSDLISALKQGPSGAHHVSRTSKDPGEANGAGCGRTRDTNSVNSTRDSFAARSIVSTNSRTALIDRSSEQTSPTDRRHHGRGNDPSGPMRTSRRPRDPYAIDTDDEDEDGILVSKADEGESLVDFLSTPPPPGARTTPAPLDMTGAAAVRRSSVSMRQVFGRAGSIGSKGARLTKSPPPGQLSSTVLARSADTITPLSGTHDENGKHGGSPLSPRTESVTGLGSPRMDLKARGARDDDMAGLRDMADFLKNSGPPEPYTPPREENDGPNDKGRDKARPSGFAKIFKKKRDA